MLEPFKLSDLKEKKVNDAFLALLDVVSTETDAFYAGAYESFPLGDVLYDLDRSPMAGVIDKDTFRKSFFALHNIFTRPGTFEFYMDVFRAVWGQDVDVTFTVPAAGKLEIEIDALSAQLDDFIAREIVDNQYVYDEVIETDSGDNIAFQGNQGLKTQDQAEKLIFELYPAGVYTTITLTIS
jgi:hypothetical protein